MARKTFQNTPKPKLPDPEAIDQFVKAGPGGDRKHDNPETQISANIETRENRIPDTLKHANTDLIESVNTEIRESVNTDMVRLTVDMPRDLHRRYKASCAVRGIKMNEEIRSFIERCMHECGSSQF